MLRVGIIGLGDMGKLYARTFAQAGLKVLGSDLPERSAALDAELGPLGIEIIPAEQVAARAELVIFSVPARRIDEVIRDLGPRVRPDAIVGGQTAAKGAEVAALQAYLPESCAIVTCHSLHGPSLSTEGQTLLLLRHRASDAQFERAREVYSRLGSRIVEVASAEAHDRLMADVQAVTHVSFEAMGTAWSRAGIRPWDGGAYASGLDRVKWLMTARIFAGKSHVYGELAILNSYSVAQVNQYAASVRELHEQIIQGDEAGYRARVLRARDTLLRERESSPWLLDPSRLQELAESSCVPGASTRAPNSQLSLLAMFDAWERLGIRPFDHLLAQTPPYRLRVGIAESLFRDDALLEESIRAALSGSVSADDAQFARAVEEWAAAIAAGDFNAYAALFEEARAHFAPQLGQAISESNAMIRMLL